MTPDIDIHRAAWLMIRRCGAEAAAQAVIRASARMVEGSDCEAVH